MSVREHIGRLVVLGCALLASALARADAVADWNRIALDAAVRSDQPLEYQLRGMAMVHVAMFETLNFIHKRYEPHFIVRSYTKLDSLSDEAAVAAAAYHVLVDLYPFQRPALAATFKSSVHGASANQLTPSSVAAGTSIGAAICALRGSDAPGKAPWLLESVSQFRPKGPLAVEGPVWARYTEEVSAASAQPDAGPLGWNVMIAELIASKALSPIEAARIHALTSMAVADAYAAARDGKHPCASCVAAIAVLTILESELGAQPTFARERSGKTNRHMGQEIGQYGLRRYRLALQ